MSCGGIRSYGEDGATDGEANSTSKFSIGD
jgi:hypothetical protein